MSTRTRRKMVLIKLSATLICGLTLCLSAGIAVTRAADTPLTFEKVVEYLELEVKEDKILKTLENSSTV